MSRSLDKWEPGACPLRCAVDPFWSSLTGCSMDEVPSDDAYSSLFLCDVNYSLPFASLVKEPRKVEVAPDVLGLPITGIATKSQRRLVEITLLTMDLRLGPHDCIAELHARRFRP